MAGNLADRLGPTLCCMAGIEPGDNVEDIRKRLIGFLEGLAAGLPEDLRTAFAAALALREDVRFRFLEERMQWLADWLQRDVRTARRRTDEAIALVDATASFSASEDGGYRDYYVAEDEEGMRYWLFGTPNDLPGQPRRWFIHGYFP